MRTDRRILPAPETDRPLDPVEVDPAEPEETDPRGGNRAEQLLLRQLAAPLLTRAEEPQLARRIETGIRDLRVALLEPPMSRQKRARLLAGRTSPEPGAGATAALAWATIAAEQVGQPAAAVLLAPSERRALLARLAAARAEIEAGRDAFVRANQRLVLSVARRYLNRGLPLADLMQEGALGLLRAIDGYDYRRGWKFSTYAVWWIRMTVGRAVAEKGRLVRVPVQASDAIGRLLRAVQGLWQELGREPEIGEIAARVRLPHARVEELLRLLQEPVPLDTPLGDAELADHLLDDDDNPVMARLERRDSGRKLAGLLRRLEPRERRILELHFGIGAEREHSFKEIGARFDLTRERIRQIEVQALRKLRIEPAPRPAARRPRSA